MRARGLPGATGSADEPEAGPSAARRSGSRHLRATTSQITYKLARPRPKGSSPASHCSPGFSSHALLARCLSIRAERKESSPLTTGSPTLARVASCVRMVRAGVEAPGRSGGISAPRGAACDRDAFLFFSGVAKFHGPPGLLPALALTSRAPARESGSSFADGSHTVEAGAAIGATDFVESSPVSGIERSCDGLRSALDHPANTRKTPATKAFSGSRRAVVPHDARPCAKSVMKWNIRLPPLCAKIMMAFLIGPPP